MRLNRAQFEVVLCVSVSSLRLCRENYHARTLAAESHAITSTPKAQILWAPLKLRENRFPPDPRIVARLAIGVVCGQRVRRFLQRRIVGAGSRGRWRRIVGFARAHEPVT